MFRKLPLLVLVGLLAGCTQTSPASAPQPSGSIDPAPSSGEAGFVVEQFAFVPEPGDSQFTVTAADLAVATELAGLTAPTPGDVESLTEWAIAVSGIRSDGPAVAVMLPEVLSPTMLTEHDAVQEEFGFGLWHVERFVEFIAPPVRLGVLEGDIDPAAIDAAIGASADGVWSIGGEDFSVDLNGRTPARPLGQPVRIAEVGPGIAISTSTPLLRAAMDGSMPSLVDDPTVAGMASALDSHGVYVVWFARANFAGGAGSLPAPFDALALGLADDSGNPVLVATYGHASQADAESNAAAIAGVLDASDERVSERLASVTTAVDGPVLTAVFELAEMPLAAVWGMPLQRAAVFAHE